MEQPSQLLDTSIYTFPSGPSMEYSAECIEVPAGNHAHITQYESWPETFVGYDMNMAYLGGMDATGNIADENFLYENVYFLPYEEYVSSDSDDGEYHPPRNFNYDYLNNSYHNEWHQEDFYNGANLEYLYSPQYSIATANCTSYFRRGTMYFIPFQNTSNALYAEQVAYTQSQPGPTNTVIQLPDVVQVEPISESTCTENLSFAAVNVENFQETMEAETPSTDFTNAATPQNSAHTEIPNMNCPNKIESPAKTEMQSTEATIAKSPLQVLNTKIQNIDNANEIETMSVTTNAKIQSTAAADAKSPLKATNAEIPNIDNANKIETLPGTTKTETIAERDLSELADTLSGYTISDSLNSEFQPNALNSNCQFIGKDTNNEGSLNSNKLGDLQNNGERDSCELINKDRNVSDRVESGSYRGQKGRNRRNRGNSRKVSGNSYRSEINICFKPFNSKRSYPSSTITFMPNSSLNAKHLNDRNYNNGLENACSRRESTGHRQGSQRNSENPGVARYRGDLTSSKVGSGSSGVHADNIPNHKSHENYKTSGASSEVSENNFSYSAAVKRSLNFVH